MRDFRLRNAAGEDLKAGMIVDRIDRFEGRTGGQIVGIDTVEHSRTPLLIQWPAISGLGREWCRAELIYINTKADTSPKLVVDSGRCKVDMGMKGSCILPAGHYDDRLGNPYEHKSAAEKTEEELGAVIRRMQLSLEEARKWADTPFNNRVELQTILEVGLGD